MRTVASEKLREEFLEAVQADLGGPAQPRKIFRLTPGPNHRFNYAHLTADEGRVAIVTNVAVRCDGRTGAHDEAGR
jgi:hypothetical protein